MKRHRLEVADVLDAHQDQLLARWGHVLSPQQRKAMRDIGRCRTAALGGHLEQCDHCSNLSISYLSCRNRHCPKCQSTARDRWLQKQAASLLPVPYSHVVFTLPEALRPLALRNQRLLYALLFRAVSETLLEVADDPRLLGARIGVLAVLHTWSQNLEYHPHLHCLVPAGGLARNGSGWIACRTGYFLPGAVLAILFRGKLLAFLKQAYAPHQLCFRGAIAALGEPRQFYALLSQLRRQSWVVHAKPPFGGPAHVLKYLARYTHRVAIANGRLLSLTDGQVRFRWRDSRHHNRIKVMRLDAVEFLRRFLLHVLPAGFVKIRHFGLLANRNRARALTLCRQYLNRAQPETEELLTTRQLAALHRCCPHCHRGTLRIVARLSASSIANCARAPCLINSS